MERGVAGAAPRCGPARTSSSAPHRSGAAPAWRDPSASRPRPPAAAAHDYQKGFLDNDGGGGYHTLDHVVARGPAHYREGVGQHFVPRGGGYSEVPGPARQELTEDERSPGYSTSLEGPLATGRDYYGPYNGSYDSPLDTRSLNSEEELRQPDSPSSEPLHYRSVSFRVGQLVWGPLRGLAPWPGTLAGGGAPPGAGQGEGPGVGRLSSECRKGGENWIRVRISILILLRFHIGPQLPRVSLFILSSPFVLVLHLVCFTRLLFFSKCKNDTYTH